MTNEHSQIPAKMETTEAEHTEPTLPSSKPVSKRGRKPGQFSSKAEFKKRQAESAKLRFTKRSPDSENTDNPKESTKAIPPIKKQKTKTTMEKVIRPSRNTSNPANDALLAQLDSNEKKSISTMQEKIDALSDQVETLTTRVHSLTGRMSAAEAALRTLV